MYSSCSFWYVLFLFGLSKVSGHWNLLGLKSQTTWRVQTPQYSNMLPPLLFRYHASVFHRIKSLKENSNIQVTQAYNNGNYQMQLGRCEVKLVNPKVGWLFCFMVYQPFLGHLMLNQISNNSV